MMGLVESFFGKKAAEKRKKEGFFRWFFGMERVPANTRHRKRMKSNVMTIVIGIVLLFIFAPLGILFILLGLILAVYHWSKIDDEPKKSQDAVEILKSRFAKGEITKKEFEKMKKELQD